jgi:TonB-dependent starch-binding outer membrane protein SusC
MKKKQNHVSFLKKFFLSMKLTILILLICTMQLSASITLHGQNLNLQIRNKSIRNILKTIEEESSYRFFFNDSFSDLDKNVPLLETENGTIEDLMDKLLSSSEMSYKVMENHLVVLAPKSELQQKKIPGIVKDKNGTPLPGVNIVITGTTQGTMTDSEGKYGIDIPQGAKSLTFSFIGMKPQEINIGTLTQIDVTMVESAIGLEEVVVVGYGSQKKKDLTGAVATVDSKQLNLGGSVSNAAQALQGKTAGVLVIQNSRHLAKVCQ